MEYIDRSQRDEYGTVEAADPSGPMTDGYVVNNHGDHKSPKDRVVGPLPNGLFMV